MNEIKKFDLEYKDWLVNIKAKIRNSQLKVAIVANSAVLIFYWELGNMIVEKQLSTKWGDKLIDQLSIDLKEEFPAIRGLSATNLKYCKHFYTFYEASIGQQPVDQLAKTICFTVPWGHNILIFSKSKDINEANFYLEQTLENNWARDVLALQIKSNLFHRIGKTVNNFNNTLPKPLSELAQQTLKDPYVFDFMTLTQPFKEKDIENQLVKQITRFLLELGKGFAFVGQQYHLEIADTDYYIDLLFYHIHLKCYVVIELKNTKFIPEYAGKLNFYLSAVDSLLKKENDQPTIGIMLCRDKNNIEVEFALRDMNKPMGVSEFQFTEILPDDLKSNLPSIEEIENELRLNEN